MLATPPWVDWRHALQPESAASTAPSSDRPSSLPRRWSRHSSASSDAPRREARRRQHPPPSPRRPPTPQRSNCRGPYPPRLAASNGSLGALSVADGVVPDGVTVFDEAYPAVANLDPALLDALQRAATDAAGDGVTFHVSSGWRSPAYQEQLLEDAVAKYGSTAEAARWVATPATSPHVSGDAVDIGPTTPRRGCRSTAPSTGCARSTATNPGTTNCGPEPSITGARRCTPTRHTTRGCSSDSPVPSGRPPNPDEPACRDGQHRTGNARSSSRADAVPDQHPLVALFVIYLVLLVWTVLWKLNVPWIGGDTMIKLVPFAASWRGWCQRTRRGRREPRALHPFRRLPRPAHAGAAMVDRRRRSRRGEPRAGGRPVRPRRREVGHHRHHRQHRQVAWPDSASSPSSRLRLGGQDGHGHDAGVFESGLRSPSSPEGSILVSPWQLVHVRDTGPLAGVGTSGTPSEAPPPGRLQR